jgi:hypothetical protein
MEEPDRLRDLLEISKLNIEGLRKMPMREQERQRRKVYCFVRGHVIGSGGGAHAIPLEVVGEIGCIASGLLKGWRRQNYELTKAELAELRWVVTGDGVRPFGGLSPMFTFDAKQVLTSEGHRLKRCGCKELFARGRAWATYCSARCAKRMEMRRYRARLRKRATSAEHPRGPGQEVDTGGAPSMSFGKSSSRRRARMV